MVAVGVGVGSAHVEAVEVVGRGLYGLALRLFGVGVDVRLSGMGSVLEALRLERLAACERFVHELR